MEVSVLITVKNDRERLKLLMESLDSVKDKFEIVVVDAYSTDGTFEYLESVKDKMGLVLSRKEGRRSVGRNECIRLASGSKFVFLDSDTVVSRDWGEKIMNYLQEKIVAGKIVQKSEKKWTNLDRVPMFVDGNDVTYPSNNILYSRDVIEKVGPFDENFDTAEDIDLNIRAVKAGYRIRYAEDVVVYHFPRASFLSLMRQSYYDGVGRRLIRKKYGVKSSLNLENLRKHPFSESSRLVSGMLGYLFGEFK